MIDIIKESELKPIALSELQVDKLFVFYAKCSWESSYIYTITKIDEERLYFRDTQGNYTESSILIKEVDKFIILLDRYTTPTTKDAANFRIWEEAQKAYAETRRLYNEASNRQDNLVRAQRSIHDKTKEFGRVLRYSDKIKVFMDAALMYYEADNLSFRVVDEYYLEVGIKFPDITITNSKKKSHKIKDLLVYATINLDTLRFAKDIEGYRASVTIEEACSSYNHSHLRSSNANKRTPFCLGDSEMAVLVAELKSSAVTAQKFEFFCGSLDQYVRWESLEGTPYIKFEDVNGTAQQLTSLRDSIKATYYAKYIQNKVPFKLTYEAVNEKFKITVDPSDVMALIPATDTTLKVIKKEGNYYDIATNSANASRANSIVSDRQKYYFDGDHYPKIYTPEVVAKEVKYYPHPELISFIQYKLEEEAEKHLILNQ